MSGSQGGLPLDAARLTREEKQQMAEARFNKRGRIDNARAVRLLMAGTFLRLNGGCAVLMGEAGARERCACSLGAEPLERDAYFVGVRSLELFETAEGGESLGILKAVFAGLRTDEPLRPLDEEGFIDELLMRAKPLYFNPYLDGVAVDRARGILSVLDRARIQSYREIVRAGLAVYAGDPALDAAWRTSLSTATT